MDFVDSRRSSGTADPSIRRDLAFLSSAWNWLIEDPRLENRVPPCPITRRLKTRIRDSRKRIRFASEGEWEALMGATTADYQKRILTLAVETGLREGEMASLLWSQVDLPRRQIILTPDIVETKNMAARVIPLTDLAFKQLKSTPKSELTQHVFWHRTKMGAHQRFLRFSNWWVAVRERAKITNFRFHDIRHTFATNFLNDGGDITVLCQILGHSSLQVTEKYAHLSDARITKNVEEVSRRRQERQRRDSKIQLTQ